MVVSGWGRGMTDSESSVGTGFPLGVMSWGVVIVTSHCGLNEYHWAAYFETVEMVGSGQFCFSVEQRVCAVLEWSHGHTMSLAIGNGCPAEQGKLREWASWGSKESLSGHFPVGLLLGQANEE